MESHPAEPLGDALALPPEAFSALIDSLIESLDAAVDEVRQKRQIELRLKQLEARRAPVIAAIAQPIPEMRLWE